MKKGFKPLTEEAASVYAMENAAQTQSREGKLKVQDH